MPRKTRTKLSTDSKVALHGPSICHVCAGVTERDYYWLTQQLVSLSNTVCKGRLVSALEGGYRIQGGVVSAFSRSVAAHVRALKEDNRQVGVLSNP